VPKPAETQQNDTFVASRAFHKCYLGNSPRPSQGSLVDEVFQWAPIEPAEFQQLHRVYAPFTGFAFRDKRLRLTQPFGYFYLGEPYVSTGLL
jgi:hypothetical protein